MSVSARVFRIGELSKTHDHVALLLSIRTRVNKSFPLNIIGVSVLICGESNSMPTDPLVKKSKRLSKVLRHDPDSAGIKLDSAGWTDVDKLLIAMKLTRAELDEVVATNNKKRFEYDSEENRIRASQGHSVEVDLQYEPADPPGTLWHGTSRDTLSIILKEGLKKMSRHHVHLSETLDTAWTVGKRKGKAIVVQVASAQMTGHTFYKSTNGVWLVDSVPPEFIIGVKS